MSYRTTTARTEFNLQCSNTLGIALPANKLHFTIYLRYIVLTLLLLLSYYL